MSAINEAYARIDYKAILDLANSIEELRRDFNRLVGRKAIAKIEGQSLSVAKTRIFAERINVAKKDDTVTIEFGANRFEAPPVVSATLMPRSSGEKPSEVSVIIKSITRTKVTFQIERSVERNIILHVIAVGEAKSLNE